MLHLEWALLVTNLLALCIEALILLHK